MQQVVGIYMLKHMSWFCAFFLVLILIISNLAVQPNSPGASQEEKQQQFGAI